MCLRERSLPGWAVQVKEGEEKAYTEKRETRKREKEVKRVKAEGGRERERKREIEGELEKGTEEERPFEKRKEICERNKK